MKSLKMKEKEKRIKKDKNEKFENGREKTNKER